MAFQQRTPEPSGQEAHPPFALGGDAVYLLGTCAAQEFLERQSGATAVSLLTGCEGTRGQTPGKRLPDKQSRVHKMTAGVERAWVSEQTLPSSASIRSWSSHGRPGRWERYTRHQCEWEESDTVSYRPTGKAALWERHAASSCQHLRADVRGERPCALGRRGGACCVQFNMVV